jgi:hypothetical protein
MPFLLPATREEGARRADEGHPWHRSQCLQIRRAQARRMRHTRKLAVIGCSLGAPLAFAGRIAGISIGKQYQSHRENLSYLTGHAVGGGVAVLRCA